MAVLSACNYRWEAVLSTFQFNRIEFVSVMPAVRDSEGNYERVCGPDHRGGLVPDALMFSVNMIGTEPNPPSDGSLKDNDNSIRPLDLVKKGESERFRVIVGSDGATIAPGDFEMTISCLEPYPDEDLKGAKACNPTYGKPGPQAIAPNQLKYVSNFPEGEFRPAPSQTNQVAVAVLMDQSGSMKGFVDAETDWEVLGGTTGPWDPNDWSSHGSDPNGSRFTAVKSFFGLLNANDRAGVFEFSETTGQNAKIVCDLAPNAEEGVRRTECFGTQFQRVAANSNAFTRLQATPKGRTPLWSSVQDVYMYMRDQVPARVKHVIVITDGPDTCHPESPDFKDKLRWFRGGRYVEFPQPSCSTVKYESFREELDLDLKDADGNWKAQSDIPIHVHFLQIQAPGYLERDPRQQEVACLTGGQYVFVNGWDFRAPAGGQSPLQTVLTQSMQRLRASLGGSWTLSVDLPSLPNGELPAGSEIAVAGTIKLNAGVMDIRESLAALRIGSADENLPSVDLRGGFRVPCEAGDSCAWYPMGDPGCESRACRAADGVCRSSWQAKDTVCDDGAGMCCWGACEAVVECQGSMDDLCNPTPTTDGTACSDAGFCCRGACEKPDACTTVDSGCNRTPVADLTACGEAGVCCDGECIEDTDTCGTSEEEEPEEEIPAE
jgi:hypothetical protein